MLDRGLVSFFYMWVSSFPSTIHFRDCVSPHWFLAPLSSISWLHVFGLIRRPWILFHWSLCFYAVTLYVLCLVAQSCLTLCNLLGCSPPGSSVHGDSPGKNSGLDCRALLQGIFSTQGLNPNLLNCRWILYCLSHQGSLWHCMLPLYSVAWKQEVWRLLLCSSWG